MTPEQKMAAAEQRYQHDDDNSADDTLWHIVHGGDLPAMENLLTLYFDNYTTAAALVLNQVLIDALSRVKERDDTAAGALWDRLVGIIKEAGK